MADTNDLSSRRKAFNDQVAFLTDASSSSRMLEHLQESVPQVKGAPDLQNALNQHFMSTVNYLRSKLPTDPTAGQDLAGVNQNWVPSDHDLAKYERYRDAALNPQSVMENIHNGTVTAEHVDALKTLYPNHYDNLRKQVLEAVSDHVGAGGKMAYKNRQILSNLFDVPTHYTLSPQFVTSMQQAYAPQGGRPQGTGQPQGMSGKPRTARLDIDPMQTVATQTTRNASK